MDPTRTISAAGSLGGNRSSRINPRHACHAHGERGQAGVPEVAHHLAEQQEEVLVADVLTQDFRDLFHRDDQRETEDETEQHGGREERGDPAEPQQPGEDRDEPGQRGQCGGEGDVVGGALRGEQHDGRRRGDRDR